MFLMRSILLMRSIVLQKSIIIMMLIVITSVNPTSMIGFMSVCLPFSGHCYIFLVVIVKNNFHICVLLSLLSSSVHYRKAYLKLIGATYRKTST